MSEGVHEVMYWRVVYKSDYSFFSDGSVCRSVRGVHGVMQVLVLYTLDSALKGDV